MSDQIRRNGAMADGSITIGLDGIEYYGFIEIKYDDEVEVKHLYGLSNKNRGPRGRTAGVYKPNPGSLKGPRSSVDALYAALAPKAPQGLGVRRVSQVEFPITVIYYDSGAPKVDVLKQCRIVKREAGPPAADSSDAVIDTLTINMMDILWNGVHL